jgi:hypothetical protein
MAEDNPLMGLMGPGQAALMKGLAESIGKRGAGKTAAKADLAKLIEETKGEFAGLEQLLTEGYGAARGEIDVLGRGARQDIFDTQQRAQSQAMQGLASRGLLSTTGGTAGVQRGLASDTSRRLNELTSSLAPLYAGLQERQAQSLGQARLGGIEQNIALRGGQQQISLQEWMLGEQKRALKKAQGNQLLGGLLGAGGAAVGGAFGGIPGAQAGYNIGSGVGGLF